jgi:hypothetical protein
MKAGEQKALEEIAKCIVLRCFRNSKLEDLHSGTVPDSKTGDYSDVRVVTPFGEIPWTEVSRISNEEMKALMIDCVNKTFTFLMSMEEDGEAFMEKALAYSKRYTRNWEKPKRIEKFAPQDA